MVVVFCKARRHLGERTAPVRVLAALVAALAVAGGAVAWMTSSRAARTTLVGYVDVDRVLGEILADPIRQETERLQKEFDEKSKGLSDEERQRLFNQYQQMLDRRYQELGTAQLPRVREAISAVAEEQKLDVVIHAGAVVWGGQDITPQVLAKLGVRIGPERSANPPAAGGSGSQGGTSGGSSARGSGR